jgi:hypothetical protein
MKYFKRLALTALAAAAFSLGVYLAGSSGCLNDGALGRGLLLDLGQSRPSRHVLET